MKNKLLVAVIIINLILLSYVAYPFKIRVGEKMLFKIYINLFRGGHVGTQIMEVKSRQKVNGRWCYLIVADTKSTPAISAFYRLHDINYAWIDEKTLLPVKIKKEIHEGNWHNNITTDIYQDKKIAIYNDKRNKNKKIRFKNPIYDVLSIVFLARSINYIEGKEYVFDYITDDKVKTAKIVVKKLGKYKIGKKQIPVIVFIQKGGHRIRVYMTDDERRIPLKITVGTFTVYGYTIDISGKLVKYYK